MSRSKWLTVKIAAVLVFLGMSAQAPAQFAVIDVAAIAQLISQLEVLQQQLTQAQQAFESMTGGRGMERLLSGIARNYLPPNWQELQNALRGAAGRYQGLAGQLQATIDANAVLTPADLAGLSPEEREQVEAQRRSAALLQVMTRQALENTSARFDSLQQLIDAIGGAQDQKAILDLQARIQSEQGMLQNEQSKLQSLYQTAQAEEWARRQRSREQALVGIGSVRDLPPMGLPVR
jgi:type IV secretion system protein VirB5